MSVSQVSVRLSAQGCAVLGVLLPHLGGVVVDRAGIDGDLVRIWVRAAADGAACPVCQRWSTKVRDRYLRRLSDAAAGGRRVLIWLGVRLLVCGNRECPKASFAEQPAGLATRYARTTPLLAGQLAAVAAALAGRAGSRLARAVLAVEVSCHTLIRLLTALPDPPAGLVRVLGVDDFSLRRGDTYATLLVDMEAGVPVGVLPDREAATFEAWLREHPEVEVICRDRAGAYARAAAAGAPDAVQVADRWHLWHNLCEHVRDAVARHRDCLRGACQHHEQDQDGQGQDGQGQDGQGQDGQGQDGQGQDGQGQDGQDGPAELDLAAVIRERHAAVQALRAAGQTLAQAAAALGLSRQVTGRFWRAGSAGELLAVRSTSVLDPYLPYLRQRWAEGTTTVRTLHAEITALGYQGGSTTVYAGLSLLKLAAPPRPPAPPTTRQVTRWILTSPASLDPADAAALNAIRARCPELSALASHVTGFAEILTGRHGDQLDSWMAAASASPGQPELRSFTAGIRQDYQAVRNGLTLPWNSGLVEGLNTRTKLIKRQMYGRAGFRLLRNRILLTS